jgi:membrane protease YdiL (CAAX protease family)
MVKKFFQRGYIWLLIAFLYAPILLLAVYSFNNVQIIGQGTNDWSLALYKQLFTSEELMTTVVNTLVLAIVSSIISTILGKEIDNTVGELIENSNPLILLLVVGIIGPILEELVFRKFIIDRIRPYGEFLAVLFSALTFGMFHGNFYQLFYAFAIGFILGFIYIRTKNIIYPIILHIAFNSLSVIQQSFLTASNTFSNVKILHYSFLVLYYMMIAIFLGLTVLGVIKLIKSIKKFYFIKNYYELNKGKAILYSAVNAGMIMFSVTVLVKFALNIFG